ncbi:MAG: hypothetical protein ISR64_10235, partial [Deltaproteobacteria bacterium]|nr:hypothetical protein [Deltaproteobacteria bacterium]
RIMEKYGRPVVTSFYDGTTKNTNIRSFILAAQKRRDKNGTRLQAAHA